jgi:hypothetical protein
MPALPAGTAAILFTAIEDGATRTAAIHHVRQIIEQDPRSHVTFLSGALILHTATGAASDWLLEVVIHADRPPGAG